MTGRTSRRDLLGAVLASSVALASCSAADPDRNDDATGATAASEAAEAVDEVFSVIEPDDPGCTVAIGRDGVVVHALAVGAARLEPLSPMTTDTIVDIGSTSKQFTANAALLLAERGEVDLEAPLSSYLSDLPAWSEETTLRQLMHHTSGIPDYIDLLVDAGFEYSGVSTDADALAVLAGEDELDFEPGTSWEYSNSNYFLLGQVVLAVTGSDLGEFLATEVFEPLDLAMVMDPAAPLPGKAVSYEGDDDDRTVADSRWEQLGDGGIQTTPSELVRWASEYWEPTIGGPTILADRLDDAVDEGDGTSRYGAGIEIVDDPELGTVLSHSGGWGGFETMFVVVPEYRIALAATCTSPESTEALGIDDELDLLRPWLTEQ